MPNNIQPITRWAPLLDEIYQFNSLTAPLETNGSLVQYTDGKSYKIAKIAMSGLADYDRANGYIDGDVTLEWETMTFAHDRGRSFQIDEMDDAEAAGMSFGYLSSEFLRTKVVPEIDALRFATYSSASGYKPADAVLGADTVTGAITAAEVAMEEKEVTLDGAVLFSTPTCYGYIKEDRDHFVRPLNPSEDPNRNFGSFDNMRIVKVPQTRFYSGVTLYDGKTSGQTDGGYVKSEGAKDINFLIIKPGAVVQITKHAKLRVFDPDTNQKANAWKVDYRIYHDGWVPDNKKNGVYAHFKPAE